MSRVCEEGETLGEKVDEEDGRPSTTVRLVRAGPLLRGKGQPLRPRPAPEVGSGPTIAITYITGLVLILVAVTEKTRKARSSVTSETGGRVDAGEELPRLEGVQEEVEDTKEVPDLLCTPGVDGVLRGEVTVDPPDLVGRVRRTETGVHPTVVGVEAEPTVTDPQGQPNTIRAQNRRVFRCFGVPNRTTPTKDIWS